MKLKFLAISLVTTNIVLTGAQWFYEEQMRHWKHCEACQISGGNVSISLGGIVNYYNHEIKVYFFLVYPLLYLLVLICIHLSISHRVSLLFNVYKS